MKSKLGVGQNIDWAIYLLWWGGVRRINLQHLLE